MEEGLKLALAVSPLTHEEILKWLEMATEKITFEVKDPQQQSRVIRQCFKILCHPYQAGELIHKDHRDHYKFPGKAMKSRIGKYRILYSIGDNREITLHEIAPRKEAYEKKCVLGRKSSGAVR